ncbi:hypothetical protein EXIGLDRAFT_726890 [Exidia glandulosa HHB12029]|uniref:Uncharacterized protein n=1 Tax=Exidia glandulosa HHB12029 TaxID=1314781 RepID=A0A165ZPS3_EXIGL|nr:hypothetical protein EXIGLDRAFT_726890 [Exidia glandulosa HHB12029]
MAPSLFSASVSSLQAQIPHILHMEARDSQLRLQVESGSDIWPSQREFVELKNEDSPIERVGVSSTASLAATTSSRRSIGRRIRRGLKKGLRGVFVGMEHMSPYPGMVYTYF